MGRLFFHGIFATSTSCKHLNVHTQTTSLWLPRVLGFIGFFRTFDQKTLKRKSFALVYNKKSSLSNTPRSGRGGASKGGGGGKGKKSGGPHPSGAPPFGTNVHFFHLLGVFSWNFRCVLKHLRWLCHWHSRRTRSPILEGVLPARRAAQERPIA